MLPEHKVEAVIISREERDQQKRRDGRATAWVMTPIIIISLLGAAGIIGPY